MRHALSLAVVMAALSFAWIVRAEAPRILVAAGEELEGIRARLLAELRPLGFEVVVSDRAMAETHREALEDAAREAGAVAALRIRPSPVGVEVWIMDRVTHETAVHEIVSGEDGHDALAALRAVELLRASLLEVEPPHSVPGEAAPSQDAGALAQPAAERPPATSLEIGPALSFSPGGVSVAPHVFASLRWHAASRFELGLTAIAPTFPAAVDEAEGRATVILSSAALRGDYLLFPRSSVFGVRVGLGTGMLWAHLQGSAASGFRSRGDDVFTSLSFVNVGASRALGSTVRVWLDASLAVAAPRFVVRFAGRDVAHWGRPAMFGALGLEFPLL